MDMKKSMELDMRNSVANYNMMELIVNGEPLFDESDCFVPRSERCEVIEFPSKCVSEYRYRSDEEARGGRTVDGSWNFTLSDKRFFILASMATTALICLAPLVLRLFV